MTTENDLDILLTDEHVSILNETQTNIILSFINTYLLTEVVAVYETIHGHAVKLSRKEGTFLPSQPDTPARLDSEDFKFLSTFNESLRWVEMGTRFIKLGL